MLHAIPLLPHGNILDAKIRRQIDHAHTGCEQFTRLLHGNAIGRRKKHHVAIFQTCILRLAEFQVNVPAQIRKHIRHRHTGFLARGNCHHLSLRMTRQQTQQLNAGITCATHDTYFNHHLAPLAKTYSSYSVAPIKKPPGKGGFFGTASD